MPERRFDHRVAIVSGAGRGMGREIALLLASRGAAVVINDVGGSIEGQGADASPAHEVVAEIKRLGGLAVANTDSVATSAGAAAIVGAAVETFGGVDILVHNAGVFHHEPFETHSQEAFESELDSHVRGGWHLAQQSWPYLRQHGRGRIVNSVSHAGIYGQTGSAAYCLAKAGLVGLTRALAFEGEPHGIKVNAYGPAANTRMLFTVYSDPAFKDWCDRYRNSRMVAEGACALAHDDCPVTGGVFSCFSGRMASIFYSETDGYWTADPADASMDGFLDNFDQVMERSRLSTPASTAEALALGYRVVGIPDAPGPEVMKAAYETKPVERPQ